MTDNVHALPGYSVPSHEPVAEIVKMLEETLALARSGEVIGVAIVRATRQPRAFETNYHGEQSCRHTLAAGVLALGYQFGKELSDRDS